ncbi:stage III sporulation protein AB [Anaerotignum sp. MB30-C6]|uniref:stage III sporulation protein AB n=1 Tax=Anaerotignum sp. MB30-C6 TaxID=3070814 RepID=UPI0027DBB41D|nr:stage III sporulation protein AB [Anaerotignum sp. MB30-C6]WMI80166.1 stage III sporulation protein AB [Anaerotignum sp. MB30-C6]
MMFQAIGAFLIVSTTTLIGYALGAREKYRLKELEEIERGILLMKNQISYLGTPLAQLLDQISWKTEGAIGLAFQEIAARMEERQGNTAEEIWESVWMEMGKKTYLTAVDLDELIAFGRTLGFLEKEQQEGSMDLFLYNLREREERIKKRLEKNGRLYCSMGVLGGLLIVITLL